MIEEKNDTKARKITRFGKIEIEIKIINKI